MSASSPEDYLDWCISPTATDPQSAGSGSTFVRDDADATDDDLFSHTLATPPRIGAGMESQIREAMLLVGYRVEGRLDDHDNSHVYRGERIATEEPVAIKVLIEQPSDATSAVRRFRQEGRLMMALRHPNLIKAIGHGNVGAIHYAILELAEGVNLRVHGERQGPMPCAQAAWIACQTANVLEYVHQRGIVHRDVKPSNLALTRDGIVKLFDLGLARAAENVEGSITLLFHDRLLGTPDFMAPEQVLDAHRVDARADLYALGCTLYYLLSGQVPFPHGSMMNKMLRHQSAEPQPLISLRPEMPLGLALVCARLMAKRPADRYETAGEAAAELIRWAPGGSLRAAHAVAK